MLKEKKQIEELCVGCGLCQSILNIDLEIDKDGFYHPSIDQVENEKIKEIAAFCPAIGKQYKAYHGKLWGNYLASYEAYATDDQIRFQASSGGALTSLALCLLEEKLVDGIIQIKASSETPYNTEVVCSRTKEDLMDCLGSRYIISSPLGNLKKIITKGERYAIIAKPCDIASLVAYCKINPEYDTIFPYKLSFFCAGVPSIEANRTLVEKIGCKSDECKSINYRGNGWPGLTTITDYSGKEYKMSYIDSWGKFLGRNVKNICRLCIDGIGDFADLSCGDLWHLSEDGNPSFEENQGRNVVFCRSQIGHDLYLLAVRKGYIHSEDYDERIDELKKVQKYQYERRISMQAKINAMKAFGKITPSYPKYVLKEFSEYADFELKKRIFIGTCKRIIKGKV